MQYKVFVDVTADGKTYTDEHRNVEDVCHDILETLRDKAADCEEYGDESTITIRFVCNQS